MAFLPPIAKASLTSCCLMAVSDVTCQCILPSSSGRDVGGTDWARTARFAAIGASLHGPFFFLGFKGLDRAFGPGRDFPTVARKVGLGQVTMFPLYLVAFFLYMGALEGGTRPECVDKLRASFLPTYAAGTLFWPVANALSYRHIAPQHRVAGVNAAGLVWNVFLSFMNAERPSHRAPGA